MKSVRKKQSKWRRKLDYRANKSVYTIAAGKPFSKVLVQYLLQQTLDEPEFLTQYRLFLPSRRACRIVRDTFLSMNAGRAMLLPRMSPIGEVDEDELSLMMFGQAQGVLDIPPAISPMHRQLLLSKLIASRPDYKQGADQALLLARALCQLMDQILVEELDVSALEHLVPEDFASHWQITLDFLKIITEYWPRILAEQNLIESVQRRRILLQSIAQHWVECPPDYPVIAAGSTGSIPAVGRFLSVVAGMERGAVVLPGLDLDLDEEAWGHIEESHPQYGLKGTIEAIGIRREEVHVLPCDVEGRSVDRGALVQTLMLPARDSARWRGFGTNNDVKAQLEGVRYFSCISSQQEASLIAFLMREALEVPDRVTALVTPDRALARAVAAACQRWGIEVDDSAGQALSGSRIGIFASLTLNAMAHKFDPVSMLALMKSPLCRMGYSKSDIRSVLSHFERSFLRQDLIIQSFIQLRDEIDKTGQHVSVLKFYDRFLEATAPMRTMKGGVHDFTKMLQVHIGVMEALAQTDDSDGAQMLWRGDAGESASRFFTELFQYGELIGAVNFDDYGRILEALMQGVSVRSAYGVHPRLLILGQLEARLSHADRVIIGGMNEGTWPGDAGYDPWMSRPMRERFGLPGLDQAIGIAAHDFMQNFACADVILTRSERVERAPTVPSRWLSRLETIISAAGLRLSDFTPHHYMQWVDDFDKAQSFKPYLRPAPCPPVVSRPASVSVTKVETWLKDPYAIYMYYVLNLRKLRPIVQDNDAAMRGSVLHEVLDQFMRENPINLPDNAQQKVMDIAKNIIEMRVEDMDALYYWLPKLNKITDWFVQHERGWRSKAAYGASEIKGSREFDIDGVPFELHGTADRIDRIGDGYGIIDYKSGGAYRGSSILKGENAQLPLEGLIMEGGGFAHAGFIAGSVKYLGYWILNGADAGGKVSEVDSGLEACLERVHEGLCALIRTFRGKDVPFYAIPDVANAPRYNDYEHISRLKEWASLEEGAEASGYE